MDLSRVGYVISICEYDERGKVVLRPDFRGQRLNLYFRDLTDGVGIATEADIEKTCKFSAKWALAARKDPEKLSITHKFRSEHEAQFNVDEAGHSSPHHRIAWRRITGTSEIASEPGNLD